MTTANGVDAVVTTDTQVERRQSGRLIRVRPDELPGRTYKIMTPHDDNAVYVTLNHIDYAGKKRLFEIFINSKSMANFEWIVALTRTASAIFRQTDDVAFLLDELRSVFSPNRGYFKPGGVYMPSLVAEIGFVIERELLRLHTIVPEDVVLPAKVLEAIGAHAGPAVTAVQRAEPKGTQCPKCNQFTVTRLDNCETCTSCGYSKCG